MLEKITEKNITIGVNATDWRDAIRKSAQELLEAGKITQEYIDSMIKSVEKNGPYIVIAENIALAHARPEQGVIESGVHFTTIKDGVSFGTEKFDPIRLIITLAGKNSDDHLDLMGELAEILIERNNVEALIESKNSGEFKSKLQKYTV